MLTYEQDYTTELDVPEVMFCDVSNLFGSKVKVANVEVSGLERNIIVDDITFIYDKELRQIYRFEHCGEFFTGRDPNTGGYRTIPNYCDLYCMCDACLARRANVYRAQLKDVCGDNNLYYASIKQNTWINIRKKFPGEVNFLCFPQKDDIVTVFINEAMFTAIDKTKHAKLFDITNKYIIADKHDWMTIVKTPENHKISGTLGQKTKEIKESFGEVVNIQANLARDNKQAGLDEITSINNEVMDATAELDPHTLIEIQAAMYQRDMLFIEIAKARGYTVKTRRQNLKVTLNPNSISWVNYYAFTVAARAQLKQRQAEFKRHIGYVNELDT